ncbi:hypothetical protein B0H66DRAFT_602888 [Apodospora peruviana]|uniref:Transglutaminase-like domain-containing protein n=1 Tax=Apodospora peruviana TaxID=516989 RepID=A0AAE0I478_9PEZI|nr:hypothetical protein B0H66DRAFT_602888 [Apodospora peruviana]
MADDDEPQFNTLAERIAALNKQKNFKAPPPSAATRRAPPPPPPNRAVTDSAIPSPNHNDPPNPSIPPRPARAIVTAERTPQVPRRNTEQVTGPGAGGILPPPTPGRTATLPPPLPTRNSSQQQTSPALPSRRPSGQFAQPGRRNSNSSDVSYLSTISNLSLGQTTTSSDTTTNSQPTRRLPPTLDQANLPPLPPTKREREAQRAREFAERNAAATTTTTTTTTSPPSLPSRPASSRIAEPPRPSLPPRLPSRPGTTTHAQDESSPALPSRRLPPPPASYRSPNSALESGFGGGSRPSSTGPAPPPIPLSSRPTIAQIEAVASRPSAPSPLATGNQCLICRDFSLPDAAAAQHPLSSLPRHDPVGYLAHVLCDPFPSLTDKARAIFTWAHHNIVYDVHGLFTDTIPFGMTPAEQIFSGKAVCEGFAKIFHAVAERAGLEVLVVCGHGKGYGFKPVQPGQPPPPADPTGHAWNAVRIDGGQWKLVDPCWGAGALGDDRQYKQRFAPEMFYLSNEIIGLRHFPEDPNHFFRADGRRPTWEEYVVGPVPGGEQPAMWYGSATEEGLNEFTFEPRARRIPVYSGEFVRFQFEKICEHWIPEKHGKGKQFLFLIAIKGLDGRKDDMVALETDGHWFWADIRARDLGVPGQTITMYALDTLDGKSARGVTREYWLTRKGRCGYSLKGLAMWELI